MDNIREKMLNYELTQTTETFDGNTVEIYGIKGKSVSFPDVSTDKEKVLEMLERLNLEQLEESQFMYFIQDELDR